MEQSGRKILVADDEEDILTLLRECLEMEGYQVITASNGAEAVHAVQRLPDLILLDVNMPDLDGYLVCEKIRNYVDCPILFLTARTQIQDRVSGFRAGGDDYILKPFSMEELLARIEAHLRREDREPVQKQAQIKQSGKGIKFYRQGELAVDLEGYTALYLGRDIGLTRMEFKILRELIRNRGQVLSKEQIYEAVRGYEGGADANIVTEHIRRIRKKIAVNGGRDYIGTVWGVGYRWITE